MCDGMHVLALATSQDHKRLNDGDQGPNTGGMGAYSPAPVITPALHNRIMREVIQPTMAGMAKDGIPYTGFLYAGLMIGPGAASTRSLQVLEFNRRMGSPETQPSHMPNKNALPQVYQLPVQAPLDAAAVSRARRTLRGAVPAPNDPP